MARLTYTEAAKRYAARNPGTVPEASRHKLIAAHLMALADRLDAVGTATPTLSEFESLRTEWRATVRELALLV